ncbi:uncharacterized protein [Coffea arabica]|uniref:DUF4283 domain-containing protein n=1 Tax=Coffea arabica TaxID=13443 RepID=A0ABM4VC08_COFAR
MEAPLWPPPVTGGGAGPSRSFADVLSGPCRLESNIPDLGCCSTHRGEPALRLSQKELQLLSTPFQNALVGRFPFRRPPMEVIRHFFVSLGLKGECDVGLLDMNHVLIRPSSEEDFTRLFVRRSWFVQGAQMLLSKWTMDFTAQQDSTFAPVWVSLPSLPLPLFNKIYIANLAGLLGRYLKSDSATLALKRPSVARVLVEMDVSVSPPHRIWIGEDQEGFWQEVEYESWPKFCGFCTRFGHEVGECFRKNPDLIPPKTVGRKAEKATAVYRPKAITGQTGSALGLLQQEIPGKQLMEPEVSTHSEPEVVPAAMGQATHSHAVDHLQHVPGLALVEADAGVDSISEETRGGVAVGRDSVAVDVSADVSASSSRETNAVEVLSSHLVATQARGCEGEVCGQVARIAPSSNTFAVLQSLSDTEFQDFERTPSRSETHAPAARPNHRRQYSEGDLPGEVAQWAQLKEFHRELQQRLSSDPAATGGTLEDVKFARLEQQEAAGKDQLGARHKGGRPAKSSSNQVSIFSQNHYSLRELAEQLLHMCINFPSGCSIQLSAVYARCSRVGRRELWAAMEELVGTGRGPWLLAGDFNVISNAEERAGGSPANARNMEEFNAAIGNCGLVEVPFDGSLFTWTNGRVWQRLDRALMNRDWADGYELSHVSHLSRGRSDHAPLLITAHSARQRKSSFKFLNVWQRHTGFMDVVRQGWAMPVEGVGMPKFHNKLRAVKCCLQAWNVQVFGNIFNKVKEAEAVMKQREERFDNERDSVSRAALEEAKSRYARTLAVECEYWRQKAGIKWLQVRDANLAYFHS